MIVDILTLFPEMFTSFLSTSIIGPQTTPLTAFTKLVSASIS